MQTKFAVITAHNVETLQRTMVVVAYLNGNWAASRLTVSGATNLAVRASGERDPRIANVTSGLGKVNNRDKPITEIAMLIKRYAQLAPRASSFDAAIDWTIEKIEPFATFAQMGEQMTSLPGFVDAMRTCMHRLFDRAGMRYGRIHALAGNVLTRVQRARGETYLYGYDGMLSCTRGAWARGRNFDPDYSIQAFKTMQTEFANLGAMLAQCIAIARRGGSCAGIYAELAEKVTRLSAEGLFYDSQREHLEGALAKLGHINTLTQAGCGHLAHTHQTRRVFADGEWEHWCPTCYSQASVTVADLHERWATDSAFYSEIHDEYYSYDIDAAEHGDVRGRNGRAILDYSTNVLRILKPDDKIKSSHYGDFLMGLEIEMTSGDSDRYTAAKDVRKQLGADYCVVKNDGSLPANGFEIVSAPRGLDEHIKRIADWEINPVYRAWDTGQCGLHVHVHSRAFTEMTLGKFLMFINRNENAGFIRKLAGRHPFKDEWASRYCAQESQTVLENPKTAIKGKAASGERYRMVNTTNLTRSEAERLGLNPGLCSGKYDTVELRVFKTSLKKDRLLAQVEFTHAVVMFCRVASYRDLDSKSFMQWLAPNAKRYPNLSNWFGVRRSKAIKDAGGKPLQDVCSDKVLGDLSVPVARPGAAPVRRRRLPAGINDTVLPVVPPRAAAALIRQPGESVAEFMERVSVAERRERELRRRALARANADFNF